MPSVNDPFDEQLRRQELDRERAEHVAQAAERELAAWPALRTVARERAIPAMRQWQEQLTPYRNRRPRAGFVRRLGRLRRAAGRLPWLHPGAISLRLQIAGLWLALNWPRLALGLAAIAVIAFAGWVLNNWELVATFMQDLLPDQ